MRPTTASRWCLVFALLSVHAADDEAPGGSSCSDGTSPVPEVLSLPDIPRHLRSGDALRDTDWQKLGRAHYERGALSLAAQHFVMATHAVGWGGLVWENLGLVLLDMAQAGAEKGQLEEGGQGQRTALLCEALMATELGIALGAGVSGSDSPISDASVSFLSTATRGDAPRRLSHHAVGL